MKFLEVPIPLPLDEGGAEKRISKSLTQKLVPSIPMSNPKWIVLGILGVAVGIWGLWILLMGIPGYGELDRMRRLALTVYLVVLLFLLSWTLVRLMQPASPRPISPVILLGGVLVGYPLLASLLYPFNPAQGFLAEGLVCLLFGLITSLISGALIWRLTRRGYALNGLMAGAVIGALSGLIGILALHWICPDQEAAHIALWHGLVGILSVAGWSSVMSGGWQGYRVSGPRTRG